MSNEEVSVSTPTIEQILNHRSIRKFDPTFEIPRVEIDAIVRAGQQASTSASLQMYTLIEIPKEDRQEEITICGGQQFIKDASYFGILFVDFYRVKRMVELLGGNYASFPELELTMGILDTGLFAQNLALAAESFGYGMCYCGSCGDFGEEIFERLNIPEKVLPLSGFAIGKPLESPPMKPRLQSSLIHHYGSYKQYTDEELLDGVNHMSEALSKIKQSQVNWGEGLRKRFEGSWANTRNEKRKRFINEKIRMN